MKRLSFRFCRRALLILAILFPIVYLCGGFFFALAGAHGENVLATEETSIVDYRYVDFNQQLSNGNFHDSSQWNTINASLSIDENKATLMITDLTDTKCELYCYIPILVEGHNYFYTFDYVSNVSITRLHMNGIGNSYSNVVNNSSAGTLNGIATATENNRIFDIYFFYDWTETDYILVSNCMVVDLTQSYGAGNEPTIQDFLNDFPNRYYDYTLSTFYSFPIYGVPSEQNLLFFHLFGERNFINELGIRVLNGNAYGFPPFRDMFNWFNDSVMHIQPDDDLGVFGLGYAYYAMNVVAVYELVVLVLMVFALPLRITDKFMGEHL